MNIATDNLYIQYQQATNVINFMNKIAPYLTISEEDFINGFFNIDTCGTDGLDNWGLLLNQSRYIAQGNYDYIIGLGNGSNSPSIPPFFPQNFNHGNFYDDQVAKNRLSNTAYRALLKLIYSKNNSNMSLAANMTIINNYITPNQVAVTEPSNMNLLYTFNSALTTLQLNILTLDNVLPIPMGVGYSFIYLS